MSKQLIKEWKIYKSEIKEGIKETMCLGNVDKVTLELMLHALDGVKIKQNREVNK